MRIRFEEVEIRTASQYPDPFPLYPYEELEREPTSFTYLKDNEALVLRAERPFVDERFSKVERFVNDDYLFKGPGTYIPRIDESVQKRLEALLVLPGTGIVLKAKRDTKDCRDKPRTAGEKVIKKVFISNSGCTERKASSSHQLTWKLLILGRVSSSLTGLHYILKH